MAGKRQHYIPQFLQRGFANHKTNHSIYTWVYRKDVDPFVANIINVGVEGGFYSVAGEGADDAVTDAEADFGALVLKLRNEAPEDVADTRVPMLLAHLEVRSRHLRRSLMLMVERFASKFLHFMDDEDAFMAYLTRHFQKNPHELRFPLKMELVKSGIPSALAEQLSNNIDIRDPSFVEMLRPIIPSFTLALRSALPSILEKASKGGHINALLTSPYPEPRVQRYSELAFRTIKISGTKLILGDSMILFRVRNRERYKPFLDKDDELDAVILPLDPCTALIGSSRNFPMKPEEILENTAKCSLEFFIASEKSEANKALQQVISSDAAPFTETEIEEILDTFVSEGIGKKAAG